MKKIFLVGAIAAFTLTTSVAFAGGKDKTKGKAKTECTKGEKKACCASSTACKKPATAPAAK